MKNIRMNFFLSFFFIGLPLGGHNLTLNEAAAILGEPCQQLEQTSSSPNGGHQFKTRFMADNHSKAVLYYQFDSYKDEKDAKSEFEIFQKGNSGMPGFQNLTGLGSEAFFQTDKQNFSLIIARKSNEIIRLKVSKLTASYSEQQLHQVAAAVLERI